MSEPWGVAPETLLLTSRGYETISSLRNQDVSVWNGYDFVETTVLKVASDIPLLHLKTKNTLELFCSEGFQFSMRNIDNSTTTVEAQQLAVGDRINRIPNCPVTEGGDIEFPYAYSHGFYSGSERYWRDRLKVSRATARGLKHGIIPFLALDRERTTKFSLLFDAGLPADFEVPLDFKYSIDTKLEWLAGLFDSGLMKRKTFPYTIWYLHSDSVDFLYQVKLLLQTLGVDSRHVPNVDHRFQYYSLRIMSEPAEVLLDLGLSTLTKRLEREKPKSNQTFRLTVVASIEDAMRSSDIYNFAYTPTKNAVLNGIFTASN